MALSVGQSATSLTSTPRVEVGDLARDARQAAARDARLAQVNGGAADTPPGFRRKTDDDPAAQRAVNGPGAALRTIDRGVASARRIVPDVKDILDLARERFSSGQETRRAQQQERSEAREAAQDRRQAEQNSRPDPAPQVSRFFGQQPEGPTTLGIPSNPVGADKPIIQFSGAQPRPTFDTFA